MHWFYNIRKVQQRTEMVGKLGNLSAPGLLLLCCFLFGHSVNAAPEDATLAPNNGVLFSIGQDVDSINDYVADLGQRPGGVANYVGIVQLDGLFSDADAGAGRNNVAELAAAFPDAALIVGVSMNNQLGAVVAGNYNANIDTLLNTLAGYDRPVYLRWAYEVDGVQWNTSHTPARIKSSFQYVRNRIDALGHADKIALIWQVSSYCYNQYEDLNNWYPGDNIVDWIGLSYFSPQDCTSLSRVQQAAEFARQKGKPLFINESTPQRYDLAQGTYSADGAGGSNRVNKSGQQIWNEWFSGYFNFILQDYADVVKGITYINADWDSPEQYRWGGYSNGVFTGYTEGYWGDSRVQANSTILSNWNAQINQSTFLKAGSNLFTQLGYGESSDGGSDNGDSGSGDNGNGSGDSGSGNPNSEFGISYIDTDSFVVFHRDNGWTGNWHYLCVNGACYPGTLSNGYYQLQFDNMTLGQSYDIEFKVQDDALSQFITSDTVTFTASGDAGQPGNGDSGSGSGSGDNGENPATESDFGIRYLSDSRFQIFHKDNGWSAAWHYLCSDGYCVPGAQSNGEYVRTVTNAILGQSYSIEFKVEDATQGQYLISDVVTFTSP